MYIDNAIIGTIKKSRWPALEHSVHPIKIDCKIQKSIDKVDNKKELVRGGLQVDEKTLGNWILTPKDGILILGDRALALKNGILESGNEEQILRNRTTILKNRAPIPKNRLIPKNRAII